MVCTDEGLSLRSPSRAARAPLRSPGEVYDSAFVFKDEEDDDSATTVDPLRDRREVLAVSAVSDGLVAM